MKQSTRSHSSSIQPLNELIGLKTKKSSNQFCNSRIAKILILSGVTRLSPGVTADLNVSTTQGSQLPGAKKTMASKIEMCCLHD